MEGIRFWQSRTLNTLHDLVVCKQAQLFLQTPSRPTMDPPSVIYHLPMPCKQTRITMLIPMPSGQWQVRPSPQMLRTLLVAPYTNPPCPLRKLRRLRLGMFMSLR
jgi:hypothetical protein